MRLADDPVNLHVKVVQDDTSCLFDCSHHAVTTKVGLDGGPLRTVVEVAFWGIALRIKLMI